MLPSGAVQVGQIKISKWAKLEYRTHLSSAEALALDLDLFVGIGNRRRIRFLRWRTRNFTLNAGSHTTKRLKGEAEMNIAHPLVREHRPVWSK